MLHSRFYTTFVSQVQEQEPHKSGNLFDLKVLRRLFSYASPYLWQFWVLVFLTVLSAFTGPLIPLIVSYTIDNYIAPGDMEGLHFMAILLVAVLVANAVVQYIHTWLAGWLGQNVIRDIRIKLFKHLLDFRLSFFDRTPIGRLVTRNVSDIETLNEVFSEGVANIVADSLQILVIIAFMFWSDWRLTLIILSIFPLLLIATYVFKEKIKASFNEVRNAVASLNTFVQEHISGMKIVQIFTSEKREYEKFVKINEEHKKANLKSVLYYSVYFPVSEIIAALGMALIVWYGAGGYLRGITSEGDFLFFIMLLGMLFRPIRMIADRFNTLQMGIVSSQRIFRLLDSEENIADTGTRKADDSKGHIQYDKVWFCYNKEEYVLKDVSFQAKPGEMVAFVGATGAGKSSIINLLNRFYDIDKGTIRVDGHDIREYDVNSLRKKISVVLQDVFLFSDSIENNITLNNPSIPHSKVLEAAEMAGAREFIERLPGGFSYNVRERGATLSVGQRQLISLVRALVYDPSIIVLDEATSSVDSETEEMIQKAIEKLMKGRTSVVIAHRLSTIQKADQIIVLDKGRIVEKGKHEELIKKGGAYAKLYEMQFQYTEPVKKIIET